MTGVFLSCLLAAGMAFAQSSSGGTVNQMSVDPEQNQRKTDNMGTTTGQPSDSTRGAAAVGNPSNSQIDGQSSNGGSKGAKAPGGSPAANQNSASTNSTSGMRRSDGTDSVAGKHRTGQKKQTTSNSQTSTTPPK
jgi:hypothetical protein